MKTQIQDSPENLDNYPQEFKLYLNKLYEIYETSNKQEKLRFQKEEEILNNYIQVKLDQQSFRRLVFDMVNKILSVNQSNYYQMIEINLQDEGKQLLKDNKQFKEQIEKIMFSNNGNSDLKMGKIISFITQFSRMRLQNQMRQFQNLLRSNPFLQSALELIHNNNYDKIQNGKQVYFQNDIKNEKFK
ncbi:hypothetical protein PPERSA_03786 [Pseudocohnilembus persalinus]|uniref:Uncharacterized protein n=1 Tax=Pseudocohnilembus persalinus TaxID=266149 RepID=A0A0V0QTX5_PSEPJ|nr:hypothetical protein PPERSA_03786 [Pseudocohnilembus persalinus]|eukprot:KRX05849.1 hypothetical protein PPERSA_03786 [Pseudocohnilembus persalinus]